MKKPSLIVLFAGLALLAACSGPRETASNAPFPFIRMAPTPPPESLFEEEPQNAQPQTQIWRRGYWAFDGENFVWNPGSFIDRPNPTAVWSGERWTKHQYGWAFVPGHWE